ncbi:DUF305 domain-containing protein [Rhodovulum sp. 12E13]|uniref:DUF305 domain-containing protein n=1 Tax=Rhodovulum sp. 12E13 TaxID=2203891 RepID=UPI000E19A97D|nr:DUF305 domain-containing protein [Rhodovulum sp. 12E13]RDC74348.1 DUF305 domain-containing protein [Rhodovulum sp. 12E13]
MSYWRFGAMIATSTVVMFGLMYLNTYVWAHIFWSETRAYMALLMGAAMAIVMLSFMWSMYRNRAVNLAIYGLAAVVFAVSLWLVRSQTTVGDVSYMRAMIPHHSIAILTSSRAEIDDPRVRKLADEIMAAQQKEISEMRYLVAVLEGEIDAPVPPSMRQEDPATPGPVSVDEALARPEIATLDAQDLTEGEIEAALGPAAGCRFVRTTRSDPILVTAGDAAERGVIKLSGQTVVLTRADDAVAGPLPAEGIVMETDGLTLEIVPESTASETASARVADMRFVLDEGLTVGYRGTWECEG